MAKKIQAVPDMLKPLLYQMYLAKYLFVLFFETTEHMFYYFAKNALFDLKN